MKPDIIVKIPDKCYVSPDPKREFPFPFFFHVTYGYIPTERKEEKRQQEETVTAVKYPQITISGFHQLLGVEKIDSFISSLTKTGDDWSVKKAAGGSDIIFKYVEDELAPDFSFSASTETFISDAAENNVVTLTVTIENFPDIEDYSYIISTKVDYTPWAKSITFDKKTAELNTEREVSYEYDGDNVDKTLYQNGKMVDTARSPCTVVIDRPTLFRLEVFNKSGISDTVQAEIDVEPPEISSFSSEREYFTEGEQVHLEWKTKSMSDCILENLGEKDVVSKNSAQVYPKPAQGAQKVSYTLRAYGYKNKAPYSVSKTISLVQTHWKKKGAVSGYFAGEVYGNTDCNSRLFSHENVLYCYAHPKILKSTDGQNWSEYEVNHFAAADFICIAADYNNNQLYIMGKNGREGKLFYTFQFDFVKSEWVIHALASQICSSLKGGFAFSRKEKYYMQVRSGGLMLVRGGDNGRWNAGSSLIMAEKGKTVSAGDYCFFKNSFYAVMLCTDHKLYIYHCDGVTQEVEFVMKAGKEDTYVNLIATTNSLYLLTDSLIIDVKKQSIVDAFHPPLCDKSKRPWLGTDGEGSLVGMYPDKNAWTFQV